jgi:F-type H+-transporting ATPase subunit b
MERAMAAKSEHTEVPGGGHKFPPLQTETYASQLVWLALTFVVLYMLMSRIALPRIDSIIADRRQRIDSDLAEAKRLKDESDAALAAYDKSLADARSRAQALASAAREKEAAAAESARKALDTKLNAKVADAEKVIATRRSDAMANVKGIAVEAAAAIVQRLTGSAPAGSEIEIAVTDVLKR